MGNFNFILWRFRFSVLHFKYQIKTMLKENLTLLLPLRWLCLHLRRSMIERWIASTPCNFEPKLNSFDPEFNSLPCITFLSGPTYIFIRPSLTPWLTRHGQGGGEPDSGEQRAARNQECAQHCQGWPDRQGGRAHRVRASFCGRNLCVCTWCAL